MQVLHVIPSIEPQHGGPSRSVPLLVETLKLNGIDVTLAAAGATGEQTLSLNHLQLPGQVLTAESRRKLAAAISHSDLVEIHSLWNGTSSAAASACRRAGVPYVLTPRGMLDPICISNHSIAKRVYRRVIDEANIANASGFHFLSEDERSRALIGWGVTDCSVAVSPNGAVQPPAELAANFLRTLYPQIQDKRVLLHLGRLDGIKRIDLQVRALARIPADERPVLLLVGPDHGDEQRLRTLARREQVEQWVIFGGSVFGPERFALLAQADLVVLTSIYDCNPVAATEALSVGGAVLATEGCGLAGHARAGAVRLVPPTEEDFANAVRELLAQPEALQDLRRRAREYATEFLAWNDVVRPLLDLYKRLVPRMSVGAGASS